jgi:hypothetical protein
MHTFFNLLLRCLILRPLGLRMCQSQEQQRQQENKSSFDLDVR